MRFETHTVFLNHSVLKSSLHYQVYMYSISWVYQGICLPYCIVFGNISLEFKAPTYLDGLGSIALAYGIKR